MRWKAFFTTLALAAAAGTTGVQAAAASPDADFVKSAQQHALGQFALGSLAAGKAQDAKVKSLAQLLASNASKANTFIKSYAAAHNVSVPNQPAIRASSQYGDMQDLKGKAFDQKFVSDINVDAQLAIDDYKDEATKGSDPQLKAFAKQQVDLLTKVSATTDKLSR
jgi:putative membrane protein